MQTHLPQDLLATEQGKQADKILRSCVHCGFCLSACPTYGLIGDELDSPRGRIYLIKSVLEGNEVTQNTLGHLDRCLTCRSCETTCPSGVEYGHLLDIGREISEQKSPRSIGQRILRYAVRKSLTTPWFFNLAIRCAPFLRHSEAVQFTVDELALQQQLKDREDALQHSVLLISGCVQPALAPNINQSSIRVLNKLGWNVIETPQQQCCGAVEHHLSGQKDALKQIKANIDAWSRYLDQGVKAIISNASGCGVMIKDYPSLFLDEPEYLQKARRIAEHTKDISEFLIAQDLSIFTHYDNQKITFHSPCTLQHGQKLQGVVEDALRRLGYRVNRVKDAHLCCGSAGTYSIFQPKLSKQLRQNKLDNLLEEKTEIIVTANIGCLMHLQKGTKVPVKHWIELLRI
ncbi:MULTISPECIES: glycolate oxidase subunit GlcF [Thiomicrorhabdus]|uniref:Glycolate oxidase iron-sulfur subunit n=1 Tax=Thiomicrorhabdus heinhorstiae TaxID=2748010 RepID=A0ABS0BV71_9GAMM|nr:MULTISPECIES: glycolate oxidase subunit GlcF [Thiomicrorhabdus]MBF6057727.1 glycolate oxidase subunit GlcF [Thiomicrorhabdus heinhorstiae]